MKGPSTPLVNLGNRGRLLLAMVFTATLSLVLQRWLPGSWLLAAGLTLVAALLLALILTRQADRQLQKLSELARRVESGDLEGGMKLPSGAELGELNAVAHSLVQAVGRHALDLEEQSKKLLTLVNFSETLLGSIDTRLIMQKAMEEAIAATRSDGGAAFLINGDGKEFQTVCVQGLPAGLVDSKYHMDAHTATGYALLQRKAITSPDIGEETRFQIQAQVAQLGVKSTLSVPMLMDSRALGAITLVNFESREYSQEEINLVQALANHAAIALDRIKLISDLSESYDRILTSLVKTLDTRDREIQGHTRRVVTYSLALADAIGVEPELRRDIERGAMLHDIGKLGVPDAILHKTGELSDKEWALMRNHPEWGKQILDGIGFLEGAAEIVVAHHERWDGQGYPRELKEEEIPLGARIFAVADAFDAMTSYRPYRDPHTYQKAREEIRKGSGNQFDPDVVAAFLKFGRDDWIKLHEESEGGAVEAGAKNLGSLRRIGSGQLQAMNVIVAALTSSLELDEILKHCVQALTSVTRATAAGIYLFSAPDDLKFAAGIELPDELGQPGRPEVLGEALNIDLLKGGISQFHADLERSQQPAAQLIHQLQPSWKSALILPLQEGEGTRGALALFSLAPAVFDEDERVLFDHVAKQLSQTMANAKAHEKMRFQAITDGLTGAYNRHYLDDFLNIEVKRCQRYKRPLAVVMLDMDQFKNCNEISGHQGGDKALQDVVRLLNLGLRSVDMVARYGGEEFIVVLPETDAGGAMEAAERMRRLIERHQFPCGKLTASLGIAASSYQDGDAPDVQELVRRADQALFQSKQAGKNKVSLWPADAELSRTVSGS